MPVYCKLYQNSEYYFRLIIGMPNSCANTSSHSKTMSQDGQFSIFLLEIIPLSFIFALFNQGNFHTSGRSVTQGAKLPKIIAFSRFFNTKWTNFRGPQKNLKYTSIQTKRCYSNATWTVFFRKSERPY